MTGTRSFDGWAPGAENAFVGFSAQTAHRWYERIDRLAHLIGARIDGLEHVPAGPALVVANHAFGWDAALPAAAIARATGRTVWALGEHLWWRLPGLRRWAAEVGIVDGTPANVDALLGRGELVVVLPGGMREAVKPRELRYRLLWGSRYGFVRAAIRHRAAIVPLACIGSDDLFDFVGDAVTRGRRWLGDRAGLPLPLPSRILPIPHRVRVRYVLGKPVLPRVPASAEDDADALIALRREIRGALHELIDDALAERVGIPLGRTDDARSGARPSRA